MVTSRRPFNPLLVPLAVLGAAVALSGCVGGASSAPTVATDPNVANAPAPAPGTSVAGPAAGVPTARSSPDALTDTAGACPVQVTSFTPPSDRLIDVETSRTSGADIIMFGFGPVSGEPLVPQGSLASTKPPFTLNNNEVVHVLGSRFLRIRFEGLLLFDANGNDTLPGPRDLKPRLPALKELRTIDESEGVMVWIAGYEGGGCVSVDVSEKGGTVAIRIEHG